ncbi:MAG: HAMP domain-containing protein, partial [Catenulispora sp.]|nr:HAMP domain-containing protein [Catenulispora sp.]
MRITQKIGILVAVPLCAVSGFGALALVTSTSGAIETGHLYTLMHAGAAAGDLVCELQDERTQVALYLTSQAGADAAALTAQIGKTQAAAAAYRDRVRSMPWLGAESRALLTRIEGELQAIDRLRDLVRGGSPQALSAADFQYHIVIADLLTFHDAAQKSSAASGEQDLLRATASLSQARESLSEEEADVLRIAGAPVQTASAAQDLLVGRTGYTGAMETFAAIAPPQWRGVPDQVLGGAELAHAGELEDAVAHTPIGTKVHLDPKAWTGTVDARLDRLDGVRKDLDLATLAMIAQDRTRQRELAGGEAAAVAGTVLLAVLVSLRLGRPIIKGLRGLRDGANSLAFEGLPAAVQELRGSGSLTAQTAEEFADQAGAGLPVTGDDEIAAVARAFNAVRHEAIRTAAEQVLLRAGVGAAFVALARRGERLTGALTLELDRAERDEQDPDRLARLFVLDHLAARMTRNNESLLVMGGEGTVRIRDEGVPLVDVIRAASGRIERYSRVDLVNVDLGVIIMPTVVDHLVHLCAELLDNATAFSPPDTRVVVDVTVLADRIIVQITDRGIGMTAVRRSQLNARLTTPTHLDAASVQAMGLTVVGQLAYWYGIAVELRPHPQNGTIAELVLPPALYRAPAVSEPVMSTPMAAIESLASGMGRAGADGARPNQGVRAAGTA